MADDEKDDEKKPGKPAFSVTLGGRQLEVVTTMADAIGVQGPEAIRSIIERWITSDEGAQMLLDSYGIDIRGPEAKVLRMKSKNGSS